MQWTLTTWLSNLSQGNMSSRDYLPCSVPYDLSNERVAYFWSDVGINEVDTFEYLAYATMPSAISAEATIYVIATETCDGVPKHFVGNLKQGSSLPSCAPDDCGICGGDNSECCHYGAPGTFKVFSLLYIAKDM
jgi:hypothetical protein